MSGMGADLIYGSPDSPQPDWRKGDPDDKLDDNDDPVPIAPGLLKELLGFDPDETEKPPPVSDETRAAAKKARGRKHS